MIIVTTGGFDKGMMDGFSFTVAKMQDGGFDATDRPFLMTE